MFLSFFSLEVFLHLNDFWSETQSSSPIMQFILTITINYTDDSSPKYSE